MNISYTGKCQYEVEQQNQVPLWYTGTNRFASSTEAISEEDEGKLKRNPRGFCLHKRKPSRNKFILPLSSNLYIYA
jgi:hypothetical protein